MDADGVKKSKKDGDHPTVVLLKKTSRLSLNHHQPSKPAPDGKDTATSSATSTRNNSTDRKQPPVVSEKTQRLNMVKQVQDPTKVGIVFILYNTT